MNPDAPRVGLPDQTPVGYHHFTDDVSINFQCNRWLQWIALADDAAYDDIAGLAGRAHTYPQWIDGFLTLAEGARSDGRTFAAAYYDRAANFFMLADDPRRPETRRRFVDGMRQRYGATTEFVTFGTGALPTYDLMPASQSRPTLVMHGGFDSFIEELFPMMAALVDAGHRVVAFDGPGQGGALDDAGLTMLPQWERPMSAILDHFALDDVTAVGMSLEAV